MNGELVMSRFKKRTIQNPRTKTRYALTCELGEGGFGVAYKATRKIRREPDAEVCVKLSYDLDSWMNEVHFGKLLSDRPRVIQLYDYFPLADENGEIMYALVTELAKCDLEKHLQDSKTKPYATKRAVSEVSDLLKTIAMLHSISSVHRDLTPHNIFVARNGKLKLADFGIARVILPKGPQGSLTGNWWFAPRGFTGVPRDDVFFIGQILAKLLTGDGYHPILKLSQVRQHYDNVGREPDDLAMRALERSIGRKRDRYNDATEMLLDLEGDRTTPFGGIRSLRGKKIVFTGPLGIRRDDAMLLAVQSGAKPMKSVSRAVNVIVVGGVSPNYLGKHKGRKLLEIEKLNKQGAKIHVIGEAEFLKLASK